MSEWGLNYDLYSNLNGGDDRRFPFDQMGAGIPAGHDETINKGGFTMGCLGTLLMWTIGLPFMIIYHLCKGAARGGRR